MSALRAHSIWPEALRARWHGRVPLPRLLWRDMWMVGTAVNIVTTVAALALFAARAPTALAALVHFSPVPYNVFLCLAVWRGAARESGPAASVARIASALWLALVVIL